MIALKKNKKGVSEMVSYVLLIIIAVGLSVAVYSFLKSYASPSTKGDPCSEDVNLILQSYSCNIPSDLSPLGDLSLTLTNRGLFNIDAIYVRLGIQGQKVRTNVYPSDSPNNVYLPSALNPGNVTSTRPYAISSVVNLAGNYTLEIEPAIIGKKGLSLCDKSIITQTIVCQ